MNERVVDDLVLKAREMAISDTKDSGKRFDLDLFHRKFAEMIVTTPPNVGTSALLHRLAGLDMMGSGFFIVVVTSPSQALPPSREISGGIFCACNLFLSMCILPVMCILQYVVGCESGGFNGKD